MFTGHLNTFACKYTVLLSSDDDLKKIRNQLVDRDRQDGNPWFRVSFKR